MEVIDYNGAGGWSRAEICARYSSYAAKGELAPRDLTPTQHSERDRHWVYPVMMKVIEGIEAGDPACIQIGIEFIEEDAKFAFGKILKSNTARALRRAFLSNEQKRQIRRRVFGMLQAGHVPREYHEYAKLVRKIGFEASEIPEVAASNPYATRFYQYFEMAARLDN